MMSRRGLLSISAVAFCPGMFFEPSERNPGCRIGKISKWLSPGYGWCRHCETNWGWVWGHTTYFVVCAGDPPGPLGPKADGRLPVASGMFPLCEMC